MFNSIWQFFCNHIAASPQDDNVKTTHAYRAGWLASEQFDDFNPYSPGTSSFHHWKAGYSDQERQAMMIW